MDDGQWVGVAVFPRNGLGLDDGVGEQRKDPVGSPFGERLHFDDKDLAGLLDLKVGLVSAMGNVTLDFPAFGPK